MKSYSRKRIEDKFTKLKVSRQRKYQIRNRRLGLCTRCGKKAVVSGLCEVHRIDARKRTEKWIIANYKKYRAYQKKWAKAHPNYHKEWRAKQRGAH